MKLSNETELENTRRKLAKLEELIGKKIQSKQQSEAHEISLESLKTTARKLRSEIAEYELSHQIT